MSELPIPQIDINLSQRPRILWGGVDTFEHSAEKPFRVGNVWCIHYYKYAAKVEYNGDVYEIAPGHIGFCEAYSYLRYFGKTTTENQHLCFNFQLPELVSKDCWTLPLFLSQKDRPGVELEKRIRRAIDIYFDSPLDAEVELWSILLLLSEKRTSAGMEGVDTLDQRRIRDACSLIEAELTDAIYADKLADALNISVSQLGRVFKRHLGCPVATYIRRRRVQIAHELLCFTDVPIQEVASRVGISDLANFNRMMKREFDLSPREIRERNEGLVVSDLD